MLTKIVTQPGRPISAYGRCLMIIVVAAIIRKDGRILISRRPRHVDLGGLWEFPGGKVEAGESLRGALAREIREELGVELRILDECISTDHRYPTKTVRLHFFYCEITDGEPQAISAAELRWVTPAELNEYSFPEADRRLIAMLQRV